MTAGKFFQQADILHNRDCDELLQRATGIFSKNDQWTMQFPLLYAVVDTSRRFLLKTWQAQHSVLAFDTANRQNLLTTFGTNRIQTRRFIG